MIAVSTIAFSVDPNIVAMLIYIRNTVLAHRDRLDQLDG